LGFFPKIFQSIDRQYNPPILVNYPRLSTFICGLKKFSI